MLSQKLPHIFYGGDYSPEQWSKEIQAEDMRLMKKAGVNLATINVFNWVQLQPSEERYEFGWLDDIMDMLAANGIYADLGTATASPPAWMYKKYPELYPENEWGERWSYGSRQTFCANSPIYRTFNQALVRKLAERYKSHPALAVWHANNEMSHLLVACYCDKCAAAFRLWLQKRYGTLDKVNETWGTRFWGQVFGEWDEIIPPRKTIQQVNSSLLLDFKRFTSDSYADILGAETAILREVSPGIAITTNLLYEVHTMDYFDWARHLDFVSVSAFPDPAPSTHPGEAALSHAKMRALKNQLPFALLEQAPSNVNWRWANPAKRPGIMRLWSYQAMAHGADALMFFQWRQSIKGSEKFHSAMVPHAGENTRTYREITQLGNELKNCDEITGARVAAQVAMFFDYNALWGADFRPGPTQCLHYTEQLRVFHYPLQEQNITVDLVSQEADLSMYRVLLAPTLYLLKPGVVEKIKKFVADGGTFIATFFTGVVDETDTVFMGGAPGPLKEVLGIEVEEIDTLSMDQHNTIKAVDEWKSVIDKDYSCNLWYEVIRTTTAHPLACYGTDYYGGKPCVTENSFGKGKAYYIATNPENAFLKKFLAHLCMQQKIGPRLQAPEKVEVVSRKGAQGEFVFVLNHNTHEVAVDLGGEVFTDIISGKRAETSVVLPPCEVAVLKK